MFESPSRGASTRVTRLIQAPRRAVYEAFTDPEALATWLPPETMIGRVHAFEPRTGGVFRMSLIYLDPNQGPGGKTTDDTDTFQGRFAELIPEEKIVWVVEFESPDAAFAGEMKITWSLAETGEGDGSDGTLREHPPGNPARRQRSRFAVFAAETRGIFGIVR